MVGSQTSQVKCCNRYTTKLQRHHRIWCEQGHETKRKYYDEINAINNDKATGRYILSEYATTWSQMSVCVAVNFCEVTRKTVGSRGEGARVPVHLS